MHPREADMRNSIRISMWLIWSVQQIAIVCRDDIFLGGGLIAWLFMTSNTMSCLSGQGSIIGADMIGCNTFWGKCLVCLFGHLLAIPFHLCCSISLAVDSVVLSGLVHLMTQQALECLSLSNISENESQSWSSSHPCRLNIPFLILHLLSHFLLLPLHGVLISLASLLSVVCPHSSLDVL